MKNPKENSLAKETLAELKKINRGLLQENSLKRKFLQGILTGFGTFLGATVIVALLVLILTQLATIEAIKPIIENIVKIVKNT